MLRRGQKGTKAAPREPPRAAKRDQDMPREPRSMVAAVIAMADRGDGMLARGNGDGGCDGYGGPCHFQSAWHQGVK